MPKFLQGFIFAWQGLRYAFKTQLNLRFHIVAALVVIGFGFLFGVSKMEWLILTVCIFAVISAELFNTAIEKLTDLVTTEMHPLAKIAKDCAAAGVLVCAVGSSVVGLLIFSPHLLELFK